jgi:beta-lactamase superfamily II metal-dependent hydrolase
MTRRRILTSFKKCFSVVLFNLQVFVCLANDEVVFFNIGEGHCTLAHKQRHDPLLIDAGARKKVRLERQLQEIQHSLGRNGQHVIENLTDRIISHWGKGPTYSLNVILTHKDDDHTGYIPSILKRLREKQPLFTCNILLGGKKEHYANTFLQSLRPYLNPDLSEVNGDRLVYSHNLPGLFQGEQLGFLNSSGCVTHLFCPTGNGEPNSWSIITRMELNRDQGTFSALIPGDADHTAQEFSLRALGIQRYHELRSDIFLYPHHGAQPLLRQWIQSIDPEVVVISAGKFDGTSAHPKAEALESLFWQGDLPQTNPVVNDVEQLGAQMRGLRLTEYNRRERIWNPVDPHRVVYYGNQNSYENIRRKLATSRYRHFDFIDDTWYTGFGLGTENGWRCAVLDFPIYTLYASGTLAFQPNKIAFPHPYQIHFVDYKSNFVNTPLDVPSETDLWVRWINDSVIDDTGDLTLLHLLPHATKRSVYGLLRREARNIMGAKKSFFLSFVVIPNIESNKREIDSYRERKLLKLLGFFLPRTRGLDFTNPQDMEFFRKVEDILFADAAGYEGIEDVVLFKQRKFLFDAFFTGPHLREREQREDLFYLYYVVYSLFEDYRDQITAQNLQSLVQSFRDLSFRSRTDRNFSKGGLEDLLCQVANVYTRCNTDETEYYRLDIAHLAPLVHLLYRHKLSDSDIEILEEMLSVLPNCFAVPVHTTMKRLIPLLPKIKTIEDFTPVTALFRQRLLLNPKANHLDILSSLLEAM